MSNNYSKRKSQWVEEKTPVLSFNLHNHLTGEEDSIIIMVVHKQTEVKQTRGGDNKQGGGCGFTVVKPHQKMSQSVKEDLTLQMLQVVAGFHSLSKVCCVWP